MGRIQVVKYHSPTYPMVAPIGLNDKPPDWFHPSGTSVFNDARCQGLPISIPRVPRSFRYPAPNVLGCREHSSIMFFLRRLPLGYREYSGDGIFYAEILTLWVPERACSPWSTWYYASLSPVEYKDERTREFESPCLPCSYYYAYDPHGDRAGHRSQLVASPLIQGGYLSWG
jgi:hypothetical protein